MLKRLFFTAVFLILFACCSNAQQKDSIALPAGSTLIRDTTQVKDSVTAVIRVTPDSSAVTVFTLNRLLLNNKYLNSTSEPLGYIQSIRKARKSDGLFYVLLSMLFIFALLKFFYTRYFANMFRVFFNTSLRQSQLTDQLLQAKLPSLLFNIFFIIIGGCYLYLAINHFRGDMLIPGWKIILVSTLCLAVIYCVKYAVLKFTGWITGFRQEADMYIFIVFLINKIVAICLIPLLVIIAFSDRQLVNISWTLTYVLIGFMILLRFFRSYSLLQNRLKVSRFHFFIYIAGIEILPMLVIYKAALLFMSKNL